jgi:hypothetical protein
VRTDQVDVRKCKICKEKFKPRFSTLQATCLNPDCIIEYAKQVNDKAQKQELKQRKTNLITLAEWKKKLQAVFNKYIRLRDANKPCISCGKVLKGKYDAGHFYSVGSTPNLRFNEMNVHGQCVTCNQFRHGNLLAYREGLINRIGIELVEQLDVQKTQEQRYTIPEIQSLISHYKNKIEHVHPTGNRGDSKVAKAKKSTTAKRRNRNAG